MHDRPKLSQVVELEPGHGELQHKEEVAESQHEEVEKEHENVEMTNALSLDLYHVGSKDTSVLSMYAHCIARRIWKEDVEH